MTLQVLRLSTKSVTPTKEPPVPPLPTSANNPIINQVVGFMERNSLGLRMMRDDVAWYIFTLGICIMLAWLVPL